MSDNTYLRINLGNIQADEIADIVGDLRFALGDTGDSLAEYAFHGNTYDGVDVPVRWHDANGDGSLGAHDQLLIKVDPAGQFSGVTGVLFATISNTPRIVATVEGNIVSGISAAQRIANGYTHGKENERRGDEVDTPWEVGSRVALDSSMLARLIEDLQTPGVSPVAAALLADEYQPGLVLYTNTVSGERIVATENGVFNPTTEFGLFESNLGEFRAGDALPSEVRNASDERILERY